MVPGEAFGEGGDSGMMMMFMIDDVLGKVSTTMTDPLFRTTVL